MFGFDKLRKRSQPVGGDLAAALHSVFDREAEALRAADFERLSDILSEKEALSEALAAAPPPVDVARQLQARAVRNAALLEAARSGLMDGAARIDALRRPVPPLQTYDDRGRREVMPASVADQGRRA
jgi:hypothetical protein